MHGIERPPWWAVAVVIAGLVFLAVGTPIALNRGQGSTGAVEQLAGTTSAAPTTAAAPLVAAFLGDSYTAGAGITGADVPTNRWPAVTCAELGCVERNFGFGGTGYATAGPLQGGAPFADRIPDVAKANPGLVVVSGGRNDMSADASTFKAAAADTFRQLHRALPDATIVAVQPLWDASAYPAQLAAMGDTIRAAVKAVGGIYVPLPNPLEDKPELVSSDRVHPNVNGYRVLGLAIAEALRSAGAV